MASLTLQLPKEQSVVLSAGAVERLLRSQNGDAALLYLALLQYPGEDVAPRLRFAPERLHAAETALLATGLVSGQETMQNIPEPSDERPSYTREDVARQLEEDEQFKLLTSNIEQILGKRLSTPDLDILLGLYDYLGLPCEVIFLLVNHCTERIKARYGEGRRPTMRQIEKEGYSWARRGLLDLESANEYLMSYAGQKTMTERYMAALGFSQRRPAPTEERYLMEWAEMAFSPEAVVLAYDKTMLKCGELRWPYMNKILKNWHEKGLHQVDEIREGDRRPKESQTGEQRPAAGANRERMRKYLESVKKQEE